NWTVTVTPATGQSGGPVTITVTVTDGAGASTTATFTVEVAAPGNTAPTIDAIDDQTVNEGVLVSFTAVGHDTDVPTTLTYSLTDAPAGASINAGTGVFTWTPSEGQGPGTYTFTVSVSDGAATASDAVTITVSEVSTAPTLDAIDDQTVNEGATATFTADGHDGDTPVQTLTYSLVGAPAAATIDPATGAFSWTTTETDGPGAYTFKVRVTDSLFEFAEETVSITVNDVNASPSIAAISDQTVVQNSTVTVTASASDGDLPANTLTYALTGGPEGATIDSATGAFFWTPPTDVTPGTYTFTVQVTDGALTAETTFQVTVTSLRTASVSGRVLTAGGYPVTDIGVYLLAGSGAVLENTTTDNTGSFRFSNLAAGNYALATPSPENRLAEADVTLSPGQAAVQDLHMPDRVTLTLTATPPAIIGNGSDTSVLQAEVKLKTDASPVAGTTVRFETSDGTLDHGTAVTDAHGRALAILTAPDLSGTINRRSSTARVIVHDEARGLFAETSITMTFDPASIRGHVVDAMGRPVAGATVEIHDAVLGYDITVTTNEHGEYTIPVPVGNYRYDVIVTAPVQVGDTTVLMRSTQQSQVGELSGQGETILAQRTVAGQVLVTGRSGGDPSPAGEVLQQGEEVTAQVFTAAGQPVNDATTTVNDDGSFAISGLDTGDYRILFQVTAPTGEVLAGTLIDVTVDQDGLLALQTPLIDPYGIVTDAQTGNSLPDVRMTLMWADTPANRLAGRVPNTPVDLPAVPGFEPAHNANPQNTSALGAYGWMVFPDGDYYIIASKYGYRTYDSRVSGGNSGLPTDDSHMQQGIIHVGETIFNFDFSMRLRPESDAEPEAQPEDQTPVQPPADPPDKPVTDPPQSPAEPAQPPIQPSTLPMGSHRRYILGYPDGAFDPERSITRAEVATILARVLELTVETVGQHPYPDVTPGSWFTGYVTAVTNAGLMQGYPDGLFRPNSPITRGEIATVVARLRKLDPVAGEYFTDTADHWSTGVVNAATRAGILKGYPDRTFQPGRPMSRAEFVTAVNRLLSRGPLVGRPQPRWPDVPPGHWAIGDVEEASLDHTYELLPDDRAEHWFGDLE
ncbi:MAG TPA: putative Ig domain-containing protein, partial [Symbiobacteriaceae bacterium]|nr:putative Ig domain-containing protein [Symbiobacteriaceae bacterium]